MDEKNRKLLDKVAWWERARLIGAVTLAISLVIALLIAIMPVSNENLSGTTKYMSAILDDDGHRPIAFIALEGGGVVKATLPSKFVFLKEKEVEVIKTKTLIGTSKFRVTRYAE